MNQNRSVAEPPLKFKNDDDEPTTMCIVAGNPTAIRPQHETVGDGIREYGAPHQEVLSSAGMLAFLLLLVSLFFSP